MNQDVVSSISAFAAIGTLLVTVAGLILIYFQLRKLRESIWSNAHGKLCDQSFELIRFLAQDLRTYEYFYNGKTLKAGDRNRVYILYAAEAVANFLEHLVLQRQSLPKKQWEVWRRFIYNTCERSVVVRDFIREHREWYSSELLVMMDE